MVILLLYIYAQKLLLNDLGCLLIKEFISPELHKFGPVILFNLLLDLFQSVTVAIPISWVVVVSSEISKQITSFMFIVTCNIMKQYFKLNNTFVFVQWAAIYQFTKQ